MRYSKYTIALIKWTKKWFIEKHLMPCPICKSKKVKLHRNFDYVYCDICGHRGQYFDGHPIDAINSWNKIIRIK
jgi:transcription elongation factor Elf1